MFGADRSEKARKLLKEPSNAEILGFVQRKMENRYNKNNLYRVVSKSINPMS